MKKTLLIAFILTCAAGFSRAQNFSADAVTPEEMDMTGYAKDTSAHAVVLNEYGTSRIHFDNDYSVVITYEYHTRIKFFDSKEFESEGSFEIPVYSSSDEHYEHVEDIKGLTYYKDENGGIQKIELDPKKVFRVTRSKHWSIEKFAMPGLRKGCVIDVSYKVISPYLFNFQSWNFQGHIPKMYSEYEVHIPAFWNYNAALKGYLKLTKSVATLEKECFAFGKSGFNNGSSADCSDITYGIKDIPAFVPEDYMTSEKNYRSAINFELTDETDILTGVKKKYTKEWKDIDYFLKTDYSFGTQLKRTDLMKDRIKSVIAGITDPLAKAEAIYNYIRHTEKWNEVNDFASADGIKQGLDNHTGNSADINLALITALNAGGIPTEAVLLSTRDHGALNKLYPNLSEFDYVVAKATIGDKTYLVDATDPLLVFGMLPMRCLNDQGRVFSLSKPSYWMDLNLEQKEKSTCNMDLTLQENGKLKGTITNYYIGYRAYDIRKKIKKFNTTDEYFEDLNNNMPKVKILKSEITNLDSLDKPVGEKYDVEINLYDDLKAGKLTFNPYFLQRITQNPFKLKERDYPVDWGMPSDERVILTLHLPANYSIETPPPAAAIGMPNNGGKFLTAYEPDGNSFTFSNIIQFNKGVYESDEYPYLKEMYNKIIQAEKSEMVFKKH